MICGKITISKNWMVPMAVKKTEIDKRLESLISRMDKYHPGWGRVFILSEVNQYYFTGTMQDGFLLIKSDGHAAYYVYRSYERALRESVFSKIYPINSYRDSVNTAGRICGRTFFETGYVSYAVIERISKYFDFDCIESVDRLILSQRAIKSGYELECLKKSGAAQHDFMTENIPDLLHEGMSEAELYANIYAAVIKHGSQGISRYVKARSDLSMGHACFGESSVYPTKNDSPNGGYGQSASAPVGGSRDRKLEKGDLVFVDLVYSVEGYHTDRSQVYIYKGEPDEELKRSQNECKAILDKAIKLIRPGVKPSYVYDSVIDSIKDEFKQNFMATGNERVKFLGHGIGLNVDELPVISGGYDIPFEKDMTIALEPKIGIPGRGMLGAEEDYIIKEEGCECITGGALDIIRV